MIDADARARAIDPTTSFVVRAPAGSGKTGLLTQRFLRLLACVDEPEQVLAVTFTRKAAAEMKSRILKALTDAAAFEHASAAMPEDDFLRQTLMLALAVRVHSDARGWSLTQQPERLKVLTIDGLCSAIVMRAPLGGNISSFYPPTDDVRAVYREAVRGVLASGPELASCAAPLAQVLSALGNNAVLLEELLAQMLSKRDQWHRMQLHLTDPLAFEASVNELVQAHLDDGRDFFSSEDCAVIFHLLSFAGNALESQGQENPYSALAEAAGLEPDCLAHARMLANAFLTADGRQLRKRFTRNEGFLPPKEHADPALAKRRKEEVARLAARFSETPGLLGWLRTVRLLPDPAQAKDDWALVQAAGQLLALAYANLRVAFDLRQQSDFIEIHTNASVALGSEEAPTDFALELDYRLSHILVDEFQDTSVGQYQLFEKLIAGWTEGDGRTLFFVGDPMQSIYRFREAEYALFLNILTQRRFGNVALTALELKANFRSDPAIVDWLNTHRQGFLAAPDEALLPPPESRRGRPHALAWVDASAAREIQAHGDPKVKWHLFANGERVHEAARVVALVEEIIAAHPDWKIGVLAPQRASLSPVAQALDDAGIPYRGVDLQSLMERQAVTDAVALTLALMQPGNRLAWFSVLRMPVVGLRLDDLLAVATVLEAFSWDAIADPSIMAGLEAAGLTPDGRIRLEFAVRALAPVMRSRGRVPLAERVRVGMNRLGMPSLLEDATDRDAVARYLAILSSPDFDEARCTESGLLERLQTEMLTPEPIAGTRVELMTVHKSKGLEFDAVLVAGLGHAGGRGETPLIHWHEFILPTGTSVLAAGRRSADAQGRALFRLIAEKEKVESTLELHRLLYVALTRARTQLHLLGCVRKKEDGEYSVAAGSLLSLLWRHYAHEPLAEEGAVTEVAIDGGKLPSMPSEAFGPPVARPSSPMRRVATGPLELLLDRWTDSEEASPVGVDEYPEFKWAGRSARVVGTFMHAILEYLGRSGDPTVDQLEVTRRVEVVRTAMEREGLNATEIAIACRRIEAALGRLRDDPIARWLLDPTHDDIRNEWSLTLLECDMHGRALVRTVVVDRSFICEGVRWIVDYKTSTHEGSDLEGFLAEEQRRYAPQLERYARAVSVLESLPCRVGLYFPFMGAWRTWEPAV